MPEKHVILLDRLQGLCGGNNHCVTFAGSLDECRARCGKTHDSRYTAWEMARWKAVPVEPCVMSDMNGIDCQGVIARLEKRP